MLNTKKATFKIDGLEGAEHHDITLRNINIINGVPEEIKHAKNIKQENVKYSKDASKAGKK